MAEITVPSCLECEYLLVSTAVKSNFCPNLGCDNYGMTVIDQIENNFKNNEEDLL